MANALISAETGPNTVLPFYTPISFTGPFMTFVGTVLDVVQVQQSQVVVEISMDAYNALVLMVVPRTRIPVWIILDDPMLYEIWTRPQAMADSMESIYFRGMFYFI